MFKVGRKYECLLCKRNVEKYLLLIKKINDGTEQVYLSLFHFRQIPLSHTI